eukprot:TRINITY_DN7835_c0_g1_i1.p1 TRINITY_DN7835_c0_g1~~TRINITY_DN7835_c0_g1_i1.p1  ORF type:complete len:910 (+),score=205.67 TRINITY_DN7835_c0_g1_i1:77-2731(+)
MPTDQAAKLAAFCAEFQRADRAQEAPQLLQAWAGRELELFDALEGETPGAKGWSLVRDAMVGGFAPLPHVTLEQIDATIAQWRAENPAAGQPDLVTGYFTALWPRIDQVLQGSYMQARLELVKCYYEYEPPPGLYEKLGALDEGLAPHRGTELQVAQHVRAQYQQQMAPQGQWRKELEDWVTAYYTKHNPAGLQSVPGLLDRFNSPELAEVLRQNLTARYEPQGYLGFATWSPSHPPGQRVREAVIEFVQVRCPEKIPDIPAFLDAYEAGSLCTELVKLYEGAPSAELPEASGFYDQWMQRKVQGKPLLFPPWRCSEYPKSCIPNITSHSLGVGALPQDPPVPAVPVVPPYAHPPDPSAAKYWQSHPGAAPAAAAAGAAAAPAAPAQQAEAEPPQAAGQPSAVETQPEQPAQPPPPSSPPPPPPPPGAEGGTLPRLRSLPLPQRPAETERRWDRRAAAAAGRAKPPPEPPEASAAGDHSQPPPASKPPSEEGWVRVRLPAADDAQACLVLPPAPQPEDCAPPAAGPRPAEERTVELPGHLTPVLRRALEAVWAPIGAHARSLLSDPAGPYRHMEGNLEKISGFGDGPFKGKWEQRYVQATGSGIHWFQSKQEATAKGQPKGSRIITDGCIFVENPHPDEYPCALLHQKEYTHFGWRTQHPDQFLWFRTKEKGKAADWVRFFSDVAATLGRAAEVPCADPSPVRWAARVPGLLGQLEDAAEKAAQAADGAREAELELWREEEAVLDAEEARICACARAGNQDDAAVGAAERLRAAERERDVLRAAVAAAEAEQERVEAREAAARDALAQGPGGTDRLAELEREEDRFLRRAARAKAQMEAALTETERLVAVIARRSAPPQPVHVRSCGSRLHLMQPPRLRAAMSL